MGGDGDGDGRLEPDSLATVDVGPAPGGQRGLLGLAVLDERVFAAWTRGSDGRIVLGEVAGIAAEARVVWEGPVSTTLANGGHLEVLGRGRGRRLVIGIGDLEDGARVDDPAAPNGKLLVLDPDGPPSQTPEVLSDGWNNPYAFAVTAAGEVWVADNAPGREPERIGRGDGDARAVDLPGERAPAALVELARGRLGLCGFLDGKLTEVDVTGPEPALGDVLLDRACRTGAVRLDRDRLAWTDGRRVMLGRLP